MAVQRSHERRLGGLVVARVRGHAVPVRCAVLESLRGDRRRADAGLHRARAVALRRARSLRPATEVVYAAPRAQEGCSSTSRSMRATRSFSKYTMIQRR